MICVQLKCKFQLRGQQVHDGGNDLLNAERAHLLNSKKSLEAQLYLVQQHLKVIHPFHCKLS